MPIEKQIRYARVKEATTKRGGFVQYGTTAQVTAGTRTDRAVAVDALATRVTELTASDANARLETSTGVFLTPANLPAIRAHDKITFGSQPIAMQADGTAVSGVDTESNVMVVDGMTFEYYNIGTQTILMPQFAAGGLNIARDLTDNEGTEFHQGVTAGNRQAQVIGTDGPFHVKATFNAADVSGVDPLVIGFRKLEASGSDYTAYTDVACIGIVGENSPAKLQIVTNLNAAGAVTTDTTDTVADGVAVVLEVIVSAAGVVTFTIDGVAPSTTKAFTFDSTDTVMPFIAFTHATTTPGAVYWTNYECGLV